MKKRAFAATLFVLAMLGVVVFQLYRVATERELAASTEKNRVSVTVATTRGTIYDRNIRPMVNREKAYYVSILPDTNVLSRIKNALTPASYSYLREVIATGKPASSILTVPIAPLEGTRLFYLPQRYAGRVPAPHLLGYVDATGHGVVGIEQALDERLSACGGKTAVSYGINAAGLCLTGIEPKVTDRSEDAVGGVALTLDADIQEIVEDVAGERLTTGAVVVMEPKTGEILASASFPTYQPSSVASRVDDPNGALVNRAFGLFDCGSVFKIITTAAALEAGISPDKTFSCNGHLNVSGTNFHCHNRLGHGELNMAEAFASSCNLYYIQLAQEIGSNALYAMASNCGLSGAISLADSYATPAGILPGREELAQSDAALGNFSFGQGYLMVSPLHLAQLVSCVVNDGVMMPAKLVLGNVDKEKNFTENEADEEAGYRVFSAETAKILRKMMEKTVAEGTGQRAQTLYETAAGKTGTAETGQYNDDGSLVVQGWFAGYYPAENPEYTVVVLSENCEKSGVNAGEVFCEICNKLAERE